MKHFDAEKAIWGNDIGDELDEIRNPADLPVFRKGVVWEYIPSQSFITDPFLQRVEEAGGSIPAVRSAPPGSALVMPIDGGMARHMDRLIVCYPFFSHLTLPVKAGELVWFTSGKPEMPGSTNSHWWLSRIVSPVGVEDENYTHYFRKYWASDEASYPNGAGNESSAPLPGGIDAFDEIVRVSDAMADFRPDAVRKIARSINGTGISGSNNNRIWCDATIDGGTVEIAAGFRPQATRRSTRGWSEFDASQRLGINDYVEPGDPLSAPVKITLLEKQVNISSLLQAGNEFSGGRSWDTNWTDDFAGRPVDQSSSEAMALWSKDAIHGFANRTMRLRGGDSDLTLQRGQTALSTANLLVDADRAVLLRDENARLRIGGDAASEAIVLGDALQSWLDDLTNTMEDFIDAVSSAVLPTSMGAAPLRNAFGTREGTLQTSALKAKEKLTELRRRAPEFKSAMAHINGASEAD